MVVKMASSDACCNCGGPFPQRTSSGYVRRASLLAQLPKQAESSFGILRLLGVRLHPQSGSNYLCPKCISCLRKISTGWSEFENRTVSCSFIAKCRRRRDQGEVCRTNSHTRCNLRNTLTNRKRGKIVWLEVVKAFRKGRAEQAFRLVYHHGSHFLRRSLVKVLKEIIRTEIGNYIRLNKKPTEVFGTQTKFSWERDQAMLRHHCPLTMNALKAAVSCPSSERMGRTKKGTQIQPVIGALISIIFFSRCPRKFQTLQVANGLQLYISGCTKKVFTRFNQLGLCISHNKALNVIDDITQHFDIKVNEWRKSCESNLLNRHLTENSKECSLNMDYSDTHSLTNESLNMDLSVGKLDDDMSESETESDLSGHSGAKQNTIPTPSLTEAVFETNYTICFDNVNIFTKVHNESSEKQNKLFNMIQTFAAQDRTTHHGLSEVHPGAEEVRAIPMAAYLPTSNDELKIKEEREHLICKILVKWLPCFKDLHSEVPEYITHKYFKESSTKSNMVPLGVVSKDEAKIGDVISYLQGIQKYVPFKGQHLQKIILFGDGLSCERVWAAQDARLNCNTAADRLECFQPVAADWHKRVLLLQDAYDELYSDGSTVSVGTLSNMKCFLQRKNARTVVKKSFGHSFAFLEFVTEVYVVVAALNYLHLSSTNDTLSDQRGKGEILKEVAHHIAHVSTSEVSTLVDEAIRSEERGDLVEEDYPFCICREELGGTMVECGNRKCPRGKWFHLQCLNIDERDVTTGKWFCSSLCQASSSKNSSARNQDPQTDSIYEYSRAILWHGLNAISRRDAVRQNDGERIIRHWKYDLLQFYRNKHHKYFILASSLLTAISGGCSERAQHQMKWCRTVNPSGKAGCNLEMDLQMEHFNRIFKEGMKSSGGNTSDSTIQRHGRLVGVGQLLSSAYDRDFSQRFIAERAVSKPSLVTDMTRAVQKIVNLDVFNFIPGRYHRGLTNFRFRPFEINAQALYDKVSSSKEAIAQTRAINEVNTEVEI